MYIKYKIEAPEKYNIGILIAQNILKYWTGIISLYCDKTQSIENYEASTGVPKTLGKYYNTLPIFI